MKKFFISFFIVLGFIFILDSQASVEAASIDLNSTGNSEVVISEPMSAEELIQSYVNNHGVTYKEAKEALFPFQELNNRGGISPYATYYRTLTGNLPDNSGFVYFYCQTDEAAASFRGINKVLNAGYSSGRYIYGGTFYYHLADPNKINYILNGHLYKTGSTTVTGAGGLNMGQYANANISISTTSNYLKPLYVNNSVRF